MAENQLLSKGLESLLSRDDRFQKQEAAGKKILIFAWTVEILAALIGLIIAIVMGYDAWQSVPKEERGASTTINAFLGGLPFLVIAVIEVTKIPLAEGVYKVRHFGWRLLITLGLIGLTFVTFETMFTGLERQFTTLTQKVTKENYKIFEINNKIANLETEKEEISSKNEDDETKGIKDSIDKRNKEFFDSEEKENQNLENKIKPYRDQLANIAKTKTDLILNSQTAEGVNEENIDKEIKDIVNYIQQLRDEKKQEKEIYINSIETGNASLSKNNANQLEVIENKLSNLNKNLSNKENELSNLIGSSSAKPQSVKDLEAKIDNLNSTFKIEKQDLKIQKDRDLKNENENYEKNINTIEKVRNERLAKIKETVNFLNPRTNEIKELNANQDLALNKAETKNNQNLTKIENDFENALSDLNQTFEKEKNKLETEILEILGSTNQSISSKKSNLENEISSIEKDRTDLENQRASIISQSSDNLKIIDQKKINSIDEKYDMQISDQQILIDSLRNRKKLAQEKSTGVLDQQTLDLENSILENEAKIAQITDEHNITKKQREVQYQKDIANLREDLEIQRQNISKSKEKIPIIENEINELKDDLELVKISKREKALHSQIYRLALWLEDDVDDIADVSQEKLEQVSLFWFGSIALILASIGPILAFSSHILRDPKAFQERDKKARFFPTSIRVLKLFGLYLNRLLKSLIRLVIALTRLLISLAEIFRGFIGIPLQRSFRKLNIAFRKRLNKPREIEVEKEVEKIVEVEKEVEKIVEVEKEVIKEVEKIVEVEKEVIKEVPVEKVVIQKVEVPKEIIRKEMVYVPLYSVDGGLIDSTNKLKNAKPEIDNNDEKPKPSSKTKK